MISFNGGYGNSQRLPRCTVLYLSPHVLYTKNYDLLNRGSLNSQAPSIKQPCWRIFLETFEVTHESPTSWCRHSNRNLNNLLGSWYNFPTMNARPSLVKLAGLKNLNIYARMISKKLPQMISEYTCDHDRHPPLPN